MTDTGASTELEDLLQRLESARDNLLEATKIVDADRFADTIGESEPVKRLLERTADDLNFYYGSLVARALNLPQPPCMQRAEFGSLREATTSIQVAHRRFSNLLHDLVADDLEKKVSDPQHGTYTLRQLLELAAAQYNLRAQQLKSIAEKAPRA